MWNMRDFFAKDSQGADVLVYYAWVYVIEENMKMWEFLGCVSAVSIADISF